MADIVATAAPMTKAERAELQRVVRLHAKVARDDVDALKAERLAELEAELSAKYPPDDPRWQTITAEADRLFGELDGRLAELCAAEGLRPEFRPRLYMEWYSRGENADAKRRTELRKLGQAEVEAAARKARSAIQRWEAAAATDLVAQGLTTATAAAWLDALPPAEELLPSLAVTELEAKREVGQ